MQFNAGLASQPAPHRTGRMNVQCLRSSASHSTRAHTHTVRLGTIKSKESEGRLRHSEKETKKYIEMVYTLQSYCVRYMRMPDAREKKEKNARGRTKVVPWPINDYTGHAGSLHTSCIVDIMRALVQRKNSKHSVHVPLDRRSDRTIN